MNPLLFVRMNFLRRRSRLGGNILFPNPGDRKLNSSDRRCKIIHCDLLHRTREYTIFKIIIHCGDIVVVDTLNQPLSLSRLTNRIQRAVWNSWFPIEYLMTIAVNHLVVLCSQDKQSWWNDARIFIEIDFVSFDRTKEDFEKLIFTSKGLCTISKLIQLKRWLLQAF